jgi:hypothetical protein
MVRSSSRLRGLRASTIAKDRICLLFAPLALPGGCCGNCSVSASDFLLYGPFENAEIIFTAAALADILIAEAVRDLEIISGDGHPLNRLV